MSVNALITADLHLTDNPRDYYRWSFLKKLPAMAKHYQVEEVYILGDLTEEKDRHSCALVNHMVKRVAQLSKVAAVSILCGNHDYTEEEKPFFHFLDYLPRVRFITEPLMDDYSGTRVLWLPHTRSPEYWPDAKAATLSARDLVLAHNTFEGTVVGGHKFEGAVPLSLLPKKGTVISGDIHYPMDEPVIYVGAPYTVDFGDDYAPRVLLAQEGKIKSIPVPGPQKRLIKIDKVEELSSTSVQVGDVCKVRVRLRAADRARWGEIKQKVLDWAATQRVTVFVEPDTRGNLRTLPVVPRRGSLVKDDGVLLESFAEHRELDKNTVVVGRRLLKGADQ